MTIYAAGIYSGMNNRPFSSASASRKPKSSFQLQASAVVRDKVAFASSNSGQKTVEEIFRPLNSRGLFRDEQIASQAKSVICDVYGWFKKVELLFIGMLDDKLLMVTQVPEELNDRQYRIFMGTPGDLNNYPLIYNKLIAEPDGSMKSRLFIGQASQYDFAIRVSTDETVKEDKAKLPQLAIISNNRGTFRNIQWQKPDQVLWPEPEDA